MTEIILTILIILYAVSGYKCIEIYKKETQSYKSLFEGLNVFSLFEIYRKTKNKKVLFWMLVNIGLLIAVFVACFLF